MSDKDKRYDYDLSGTGKVAWGAGWRLAVIIVCVIVFCGALSLAGFAISTAVSGPKGQAQAYQEQQSKNNRLFAQANFEDRFNQVVSDVFSVKAVYDTYKLEPTDINLTALTGTITACGGEVTGYDADANKYLLRNFRSIGLPRYIDPAVCLKPDNKNWQAMPERTETP